MDGFLVGVIVDRWFLIYSLAGGLSLVWSRGVVDVRGD